jgi:hypothetical protein
VVNAHHDYAYDDSHLAQNDDATENRHSIDLKISEEVTHCSFLSGL